MKIRVLGKYSPFPPANGACPGYWVTSGENGILLECGPGVISRFGQFEPLSRISAVILSHLHFDHISDFLALRYAAFPDKRYRELPPKIRVFAPSSPEKEFSLLSYKEGVEACQIPSGKAGEPGAPGNSSNSLIVNGFRVSFYEVEHSCPSYAIRIEDSTGAVLAYSGDTRPCRGLLEAAKGADLFLCEASAVEEDAEFAKSGHLTARQAGEVAREAGVSRLLLTHIWPLYDENVLLRECREVFGDSEVAVEGREYQVSSMDKTLRR
ncbi:MAG: MBL fold metallo-hydrolase [Candidatus Fermentithermobacillus carboniphilus]|uniref:MBL fold metallo-hydrolase n=1 Tax=Candidatus Fermentithermobacillus carboniphilus TaxID=3085328 RepID=A0AAT9LD97_9FIRM|nr:MAG: MBL fold metallo-hydrolase [Candidatus Fermentithermobacillus carboniphilus]